MKNLLKNANQIHFIGIGGSGMSGLARLLMQQGKIITGSDEKESTTTIALTQAGIKITEGHAAKNLEPKPDLIIYSSAIPANNPELIQAQKLNLTTITYPEAVGILTRENQTIAICGTHGKTTTTAMLAASFLAAGKDPSVIVGASIRELNNQNQRLGKAKLLILEACEYRRAFLNFEPAIIIITNIEVDHLDYYKNLADYNSAFEAFIAKLPEHGLLIANADDENLNKILKKSAGPKIITYGKNSQADYQIKDNSIFHHGQKILELTLKIPGEHNLMNAAATIALANEMNLDLQKVKSALQNYAGAARRFEFKGQIGKTTIIDDYAHHPTEIKATLKAARAKFGATKKILCVFQPHQYSRTAKLLDDFATSFNDVDAVIISNILRVRDTDAEVAGISPEILVEKIAAHQPNVLFGNGLENTAKIIQSELQEYDIIITMGAGDVWKIGEIILSEKNKI